MIQAILFDLDGTLIDSFVPNLEFFQALMEQTGYEPPTRRQYETLSPLPLTEVIRTLTGLTDPIELGRTMRESENLKYDRATPYRLSPGVSELIPKLAAKYSLGIVTNTPRAYVFKNPLRAYAAYFSVVVAYEDVQRHKPDPAPVLLALEKLGARPEQSLYIGDARTDMQAGEAAGVHTLAYGDGNVQGTLGAIGDLWKVEQMLVTGR